MLSELVLSCVFQEAAVYGEHIWFETSVSGDFCYVGEQNCMAKLLVSHLGLPVSPATATNPAVCRLMGRPQRPHCCCCWGSCSALGHCQGRDCVPPASAYWKAKSPVSANTGSQFAMGP